MERTSILQCLSQKQVKTGNCCGAGTFQISLKEDEHNKGTQWKGQELIHLLLPVLLDILFPYKNQHKCQPQYWYVQAGHLTSSRALVLSWTLKTFIRGLCSKTTGADHSDVNF